MLKKIIIVVVLILAAIQFITIDQTNPPIDMSKDFISLTNPPSDLANVIKSSCYDCHSNHTKYPWYSNVAPASWLIKEHINNGRNHLNFSIWTDYIGNKKDHKLEECIDMIKSGEMPMEGYVMFHEEAEINHEQKMQLINWLTELRDSL
jgi:hypothetical protein